MVDSDVTERKWPLRNLLVVILASVIGGALTYWIDWKIVVATLVTLGIVAYLIKARIG